MLAVDTNVIVRYLANDRPEQAARARALIESGDVFACKTVLLETEWVLRELLSFSATRVAAALRGFAGLPGVTVENSGPVARALD